MPQSQRSRRSPRPRTKDKVLRGVQANAGIRAAYAKKLDALIAEMQASVEYFVKAAYRANEPRSIAQDETPADALQRAIKGLAKRWLKRFDEAAPKLAAWFAQATQKRSSDALKKILKDGGISVEFQMTPAMRDIVDATVHANVALIKSIPSQYFGDIEGIVMRSVQTGRDVGALTKELQKRYGVTRRRVAFIALDQNNKATEAMGRARKLEAGLDEEEWHHSHGGREPRPTHVQAGREKIRYSLREGWYDPALKRRIFPGQEPGCRCFGKPVVKGFS